MNQGGESRDDPGDDSVILRTRVLWQDSVASVLKSSFGDMACGTVRRREDGLWEIVFSVDRNRAKRQRQRHFLALDVDGVRRHPHVLMKLDRITWDVDPSVHFRGQFHGFVTLLGVPESVPWAQSGGVS